MRLRLSSLEGQRKIFRATFSKFGKKINYKGYSESTLLLTDVVESETNTRLTDHVWFSYTRGFEDAGIKEGDTLEFEARVKEYKKGYANKKYNINNKTADFKLSHPTKIVVIN
ncbi:MAG TPA: hypothetical protein PLR06_06875 [Cyclobacteriaceae bacterium]|nr:hypothetical protein [Cyclobacteriaceae bacterium]